MARPLHGFGSPVDAELGVDVAHVGLDGAEREVELPADLGRGEVAWQVSEHTQLAFAQVLAQLRPLAGRSSQWRAIEHVEDVRDQRRVGGAVAGMAREQLSYRDHQEW